MKNSISVKKKVFFLTPLPPPYYGSAISSLMCLNILKDSFEYEVDNVKLNYSQSINGVGRFSFMKFFGGIIVFFRILFFLVRKNYDIVYIVPATSGFALYRDFFYKKIVNLLSRAKVILHLRSRFLDEDKHSPLNSFVIKKLLKSDLIILIGKELESNVKQFYPNHLNLFFLPNAISASLADKDFDDLIHDKYNNIEKRINILFLSNMNIEKGWFKLLEALKLMKNADIQFESVFIGGWPSEKEKSIFYDYVTKNSLNDQVRYLGPIFNEEKFAYLKAADVLVFPTEYKLETFGRVIVEAMEFGIPVISSNIATIPSIILHNETGFILDDNTPEEITFYISQLCNKERIFPMSLKSRERFLSSFTESVFKARFKSIFEIL